MSVGGDPRANTDQESDHARRVAVVSRLRLEGANKDVMEGLKLPTGRNEDTKLTNDGAS
jgi:hypothetical protein